jgi:hypothetical protein
MPDLYFKVTGVEATSSGLTPLLQFKLQISVTQECETIEALIIQAQIQIQSAHRHYNEQEKEKLVELFGIPDQWGQTLRNKLWANVSTTVGQFKGNATAVLPVQCTYDLNIAATKYFRALEGGEVPLLFFFSGTVFHSTPDGRLQVEPISWDKECTYRMPVRAWEKMMQRHYPNSAWIPLQMDVFEQISAYKRNEGMGTWEETIQRLLPRAESPEEEVNKKSLPFKISCSQP